MLLQVNKATVFQNTTNKFKNLNISDTNKIISIVWVGNIDVTDNRRICPNYLQNRSAQKNIRSM